MITNESTAKFLSSISTLQREVYQMMERAQKLKAMIVEKELSKLK